MRKIFKVSMMLVLMVMMAICFGIVAIASAEAYNEQLIYEEFELVERSVEVFNDIYCDYTSAEYELDSVNECYTITIYCTKRAGEIYRTEVYDDVNEFIKCNGLRRRL